jgi:hypothetical protein
MCARSQISRSLSRSLGPSLSALALLRGGPRGRPCAGAGLPGVCPLALRGAPLYSLLTASPPSRVFQFSKDLIAVRNELRLRAEECFQQRLAQRCVMPMTFKVLDTLFLVGNVLLATRPAFRFAQRRRHGTSVRNRCEPREVPEGLA